MPTLYELRESYSNIQQLILEGGEGLDEALSIIQDEIENKLESYVMVIRNLEADATAFEREEKSFKEKKQVAQNGVKRMKQAIQDTLLESGRESVKTEKFNISFRKNAPSVQIEDESLIPDEFFKVERTISRAELARRLKLEEIPGAKLVASKSIQIK